MGFLDRVIQLTAPKSATADHSTLAELIVASRLQATGAATSPSAALAVASIFRARQMNADTVASLELTFDDGGLVPPANADLDIDEAAGEIILSMQDHGEAYLAPEANSGRFKVVPFEDVHVQWLNGDFRTRIREYRSMSTSAKYRTSGMFPNLIVIAMNRGASDLTGVGPMESPRIAGLLAEQKYSQEYFENHGSPTGILKFNGNVTDEQARVAARKWVEARTTRSPAVLGGNVDWAPQSFSANDSLWTDTHLVGIGDVATLFGCPARLLNYNQPGSSLTYENVDHVYTRYWRETLQPTYARRILRALSRIHRRQVFINPEPLFKADLQTRTEAAGRLTDAGYTPADVLDAVSLPAMGYDGKREAITDAAD